MKKLRYTLFLVLLFFSAQAAHVDTIQVFSPSMNKNIKTCVIVPDNYKKSKKKFPIVYLLRFAALRRRGFSALNFIKCTKLEFSTSLS